MNNRILNKIYFFKIKIAKLFLQFKQYIIRDFNDEFDIEKEAQKLGMTIEEYRRQVLLEKPKTKLYQIYDEFDSQIQEIEKVKDKFNNDIRQNKVRQEDFYELECFYKSLL